MNILLLAPELFTGGGGIPRILRLYLKALCERSASDNVRFISLNDRVMDTIELKRYSTDSLVEWEVCSRSKASFIRGALQMGRRSDIIVCGHVGQLPVAWAASKINRRLRYYLVAHGIEVWRRFSLLERMALRGASGIWCVSAFTRKQLLERCALDEEKVVVVPNALDPLLVPPSPPRPPPAAPEHPLHFQAV